MTILVMRIAKELGISESYIEQIASTSSHRYKTYAIPKRNGGTREINHPAKELKALQRWISNEILSKLPVHSAAMAYRPLKSIRHNASIHAKSRFLLRMDFEDFFHSLSTSDIVQHLKDHQDRLPKGWSDTDTGIISALMTRHGRLAMGAVTSPALSNTLCAPLDTNLSAVAATFGCTYTRYADDLYFSTSTPNTLKQVQLRVAETIKNIKYPEKLRLNDRKTIHTSTKRNKTVTGITLTPTGSISVGRTLKRKVRSTIFRSATLSESELRSLAGLLGYCKDVEPEFISRLIIKYGVSKVDSLLKAKLPSNESPIAPHALSRRLAPSD